MVVERWCVLNVDDAKCFWICASNLDRINSWSNSGIKKWYVYIKDTFLDDDGEMDNDDSLFITKSNHGFDEHEELNIL